MIDDTKRGLGSRLAWRTLVGLYRQRGYAVANPPPAVDKCLLVGAPHTSNWDFIVFAGVMRDLGITPSFIGKETLFRWPATRFMYDMGGMPVNRSKAGGYVQAVVKAIEARRKVALVVAPEGSRTSDGRWRSGFWHIAKGAGVPFVPAAFDSRTRLLHFGEAMMPGDSFLDDLGRLAAYFKSILPDCPRFDMLAAQARGEVEGPGRQRGSDAAG